MPATMIESSIAKCANPDCDAKFRRLGVGKLYLQASHSPENRTGERVQKAAWVCERCALRFTVRYNDETRSFILVPSGTAAA